MLPSLFIEFTKTYTYVVYIKMYLLENHVNTVVSMTLPRLNINTLGKYHGNTTVLGPVVQR